MAMTLASLAGPGVVLLLQAQLAVCGQQLSSPMLTLLDGPAKAILLVQLDARLTNSVNSTARAELDADTASRRIAELEAQLAAARAEVEQQRQRHSKSLANEIEAAAHREPHGPLALAATSGRMLTESEALHRAKFIGASDIVSLCVVVLVILLALYFVWGGSWTELKENPLGELRGTAQRAGGEARDKFQSIQNSGKKGQQNPFDTQPMDSQFATQPLSSQNPGRRTMPNCC
eukprot:TRINITY_DN20893_c0_g1_i1.p1 TRINITY_DN20893_c0_g1~~TRINITY_DN20893_c0_g1_i1.p1  ORF type:complete len:233 (+),score=44.41 TRINITY_DN20893_c0_g1_i1:201-899(+)